jgi:hypothetical protein
MVLSSLAVIANSLRLKRFETAHSRQPEAQARGVASVPSPDEEFTSERQVRLETCAAQEAET